MALTKIDDRGLKTPIDLLDNEKIRFGTDNDLQIYHNGSQAILDNDTGDTYIKAAGMISLNPANTEDGALIKANGAVELMYDNSKKAETASWGLNVLGNCGVGDSSKFQCGDSQDLQLYHNGSYNYITGDSTGKNLYLRANVNDEGICVENNGPTYLAYDGSYKFQTSSNGVRIPDDIYLGLGNSDDLNLRFLNGTGAFIQSGGNTMYIRSNLIEFGDNSGNKYIKCIDAGAVELYHGVNAKKLETTSNGVEITGRVKANSSTDSYPIRAYNSSTSASAKTGINLQLERNASAVQFDAVRLIAGKRQEWTGVPSTVDSYFAAEVINNESMVEKIRVDNDGLKFNGDTSNSNSLNDYERGDWSIGIQSGASAVAHSQSNDQYIKVGNLVTVWGEIESLTSPDSNILELTGLPYPVRGSVEGSVSCMVNYANAPTGYTTLQGYIYAGQSRFRFYWSGSGQPWRGMTGAELTASGAIIYSISYYTDS